jgi:D-alanyl-D-alanine carboxypeptidase
MPSDGAEMQAILDDTLRRNKLPALAAAVVRSEEEAQLAVTGLRRIGESERVTAADRFHIGSNAKAMTASLIASLIEEGKLSWSTRPRDLLPELSGTMHPGYRDATIEQLLTHRAGVPPYISGFALAMLPDEINEPMGRTPSEWRRAFAVHVLRQAPKKDPGSFLYSNAGYTIAAVMAEAVTGESWEALMQSRVFGPLEIEAGFRWPAAADPAQPWGHRRKLLHGLSPHDPHDRYQLGPLLAPAGDVHLSIGAYARFLQEQLRGLRGADGLLTAVTVRRLHQPVGDYAAGWSVQHIAGERASVHEGSAGTFHAVAILLPERDLAVAVFTNAGSKRAAGAVRELAQRLIEGSTSESRNL